MLLRPVVMKALAIAYNLPDMVVKSGRLAFIDTLLALFEIRSPLLFDDITTRSSYATELPTFLHIHPARVAVTMRPNSGEDLGCQFPPVPSLHPQ